MNLSSPKQRSLLLFIVLFTLVVPFVFSAQINSTTVDGLIAYGEASVSTARYRLWNSSATNFSDEFTNTNDVGSNMVWFVTRANHERDEILVGAQDRASDLNVQVVNGTRNWTNLVELSTSLASSAARGYDIAYEDISGDALLVYENNTASDGMLQYRTWNGASYSAEQTIALNTSFAIFWVSLYPKPGTDDIMLVTKNAQNFTWAIPWNGTDFIVSRNTTITNTSPSSANQDFAFAWESSSGDGLAVYGDGTTLMMRNYTQSTGVWATNETIANFGDVSDALRLCSDPTSDSIGIIINDAGLDVNVRMWNGTQILGSPPLQDATVEPTGANNANVDCAWHQSGNIALFGFIDINSLNLSYFTYTKANTSWSVGSLVTAATTSDFAGDDIEGLRFTPNPSVDQIMITALDIAEDLTATFWNGTAIVSINASPLETTLEATNAASDADMFDWDRYDPQPTVLNLTLNTTAVPNLNERINFTVNITDNLGVSIVTVNVTKPLGSVTQANLTNVGSIYNLTFSGTNETGTYTIRVIANDTSRHNNINDTQTITFTAGDVTKPVVLTLAVNDSTLNQNEVINISVNVTDTRELDTVLVNVSIPTLSLFDQYRMTNVSSALFSIFNLTFANTSRGGTYTARVIANDTSGNINDTETITFSVGDVTRPVVTALRVNDTVLNVSETLNFTVNVTDETRVDVVLVNITVPGVNEFDQYRLTNVTGSAPQLFNLTFANTSRKGTYLIRVLANDTSGNLNITETLNFSVGDTLLPTVTLTAPVDQFNSSSPNVSITFTPRDDTFQTVGCNLTIDSNLNATNTTAINNTATTVNGINYALGNHTWNVSCWDGDGNQNTSVTRTFRIDFIDPAFNSLTNIPSDNNSIDPSRNIAFYANVTDNITAIHTVLLQYKPNTTAVFTNVTMTFNNSNNLYEASFTPTEETIYNVQLYANDTVDNNGTSNQVNISALFDRTWTRAPITAAEGTVKTGNISLVNITLNNTGDYALNFTMTSSYSNTTFNTSFPLQLASNETRIVAVNATAPSTLGSTTINIEINATPNGDPSTQNTTVTLAVTDGQPFLAATFVTIPTSATKGDSITIEAKVRNIGTDNATNGTLFFTLPSGWTLAGGLLNNTFTQLFVNDEFSRSITVNIPSSGDSSAVVKVNTTGRNETEIDIVPLLLVSGEERTISLADPAQLLGAGETEQGSSGQSIPQAETTAPPSTTTSTSTDDLQSVGTETTVLETYEKIYVVIGEEMEFPITVTNIYENAVMQETTLAIEGYLSQYLSWEPQMLSPLVTNEQGTFTVTVAAPSYKGREEHELLVTLESIVEAEYKETVYNERTNKEEEVITSVRTKIIEKRYITLIILETSQEEALAKKTYTEEMLLAFREKGLGTEKLLALYEELLLAYNSEEYGTVDALYQEIVTLTNTALEAYAILEQVKEQYELALSQGYDTGELGTLIELTEAALSREDFTTALFRAKEADFYRLAAVEQQFHLRTAIKEMWKELLLLLFLIPCCIFVAYRAFFLYRVDHMLTDLDTEERILERRKRELQKIYFTEKKMSEATYFQRMHQTLQRLQEIHPLRLELLEKRAFIVTIEEKAAHLLKHKESVQARIKRVQEEYYHLRTIPLSFYEEEGAMLRERMTVLSREYTMCLIKKQKEQEAYNILLETFQALEKEEVMRAVQERDIAQLALWAAEGSSFVGLFCKRKVKAMYFSLLRGLYAAR